MTLTWIILDSTTYWEERYKNGGNSGAGSYHHLAEFKANVLNNYFSRNPKVKVVEYGCGDGNQLSMLRVSEYIGYDVSSTIIAQNMERFKKDSTKHFRCIGDDMTEFEKADVVLSMDVIFHLVSDDVYERYMQRLFTHPGASCVIIYSTNTDRIRAPHVRDRKILPYIGERFPDWELFKRLSNPYSELPHPRGSSCNFFFFRKK